MSVDPVFSTVNKMFVSFISRSNNGQGTAQGFQFSYSATLTNATGCGGKLTAPPEGIVTSPNHPDDYGTNEICEWIVKVPEGNTVRLTFGSFNLEEDYDFLNIFNGATPISNARCGGFLTAPPKGYVKSPNYPKDYGDNETCEWTITVPEGITVRLRFHRFQLDNVDSLTIYDKDGETTPTSVGRCGGYLTAPPVGIVTSPNYPNDYGNEENCDWTITVPEGNIVRLTFDSFVTEVDFDFLFVYDGGSDIAAPLKRLTGDMSAVDAPTITSTSTQMFVRFTSDESISAQGFQFYIANTARCGGSLAAPPEGYVTSTNFPRDYGNNEICEWTIIVPEGITVSLKIESVNIEDGYDYLDIYDVTLAPGCKGTLTAPPDGIVTSPNYPNDYGTNETSKTEIPISNARCGGSMMAPPKGYVKSPNYPMVYRNNENCEWTITVPEGNTVSLTVDSFNVEDGYDFLNIYDGDSDSRILLRSYTGDESSDTITSISNYMYVRFTSNRIITAQGFLFSYTANTATPISNAKCGGSLTAPPKGYVTSPNYPMDYGDNKNCEWTITVPEGSTVRLTFHSFQLENADSLTIYDLDGGSATQLQSYTGVDSVYPITSASNEMLVRLTSSPSYTAQGFIFSYTGIVTSPNYPNDYGNEENCDWTITVPEGNIVRLTFDSFVTEVDFDFLFVYDGDSDTAAPLQRLTGGMLAIYVPAITSTSTQMFVRFTSDESITAQGFQFSYIESARCGGFLTYPPGGIVTSPNYPMDYGDNETCEWTITVPEGYTVRLTFQSFQLENADSLTIYDKDGELPVYAITSASNEMLVRFISDHSDTAQGFKFSYTAYTRPLPSTPICGRSLTAPPRGYVTSPNYPGDYSNNENCEWTIIVPEGNTVSLTIESVNIENCCDFLDIYDGDSSSRIWLRR
ncbi:cubilin-like [Branchiostoma lanceolatum]|uniref:cubilin-like n=1 Tax=Branchiostoma lanceolatum TaxID=7740 RepID=UPI00345725D0